MFPNPQSALPLPPRPSLERYRKLAKDLVKACRSADERGSAALVADADRDADADWAELWAEDWVDSLVRLTGFVAGPHLPVRIPEWIDSVAAFARRQMAGDGTGGRRCALANAQFVIARSHGFESWPKFARQLEALESGNSSATRFEAAADAIVAGNAAELARLLKEDPGLIRARSIREHRAALLHYVAANGVEGYRQRTPLNIVEIARILLDAGADVDAEANVYGRAATVLDLAATSAHPERTGVQEDLLRLLLERGARISHGLVMACLSNGRKIAAEFLAGVVAERGGPLDVAEAAGVGRLDLVRECFTEDGGLRSGIATEQLQEGLLHACEYGQDEVVEFLIARRADLAALGRGGQTSMHRSVIGGHPTTVKLLLRRGAPLEARNRYGGTVLDQALWSAGHGGDTEVYLAILDALADAGALVPERHVPVNARVDAWLERHGSRTEPTWYWFGEKPVRDRRQNLPK